jgi:hypothetical protein
MGMVPAHDEPNIMQNRETKRNCFVFIEIRIKLLVKLIDRYIIFAMEIGYGTHVLACVP